MSKQVKCCKQTSALDVATQWACAELLQRWVCCITTTESSILLCHHKRDYIACMTQVAGSMGGVGVEGSGGGGAECRVHPLAVMGCELVQCNWPLQQVLYGHFRRKQGSITSTLVQYSQYCFLHTVVPSPFP